MNRGEFLATCVAMYATGQMEVADPPADLIEPVAFTPEQVFQVFDVDHRLILPEMCGPETIQRRIRR